MVNIQSFKNIHKDNDIYIIASGKSLDYINASVFDNKITIGINQAHKKFDMTYLIRKEVSLDLYHECMQCKTLSCLFVSRGKFGHNDNHNVNLLKSVQNVSKVCFFDHDHNCHNVVQLPDDDKLIVSHSTITSGIHLAAYMGAKNIIIVGHDCGTIDGECNFKGYHTETTYNICHKDKNAYVKWLKLIESGTIKLKSLLSEKYKCNIYSLNPFINFGLEGHKYIK